jgi:hypothetical protein
MAERSSPALQMAVREFRLGRIPKAPKAPKAPNTLSKKRTEKALVECRVGGGLTMYNRAPRGCQHMKGLVRASWHFPCSWKR